MDGTSLRTQFDSRRRAGRKLRRPQILSGAAAAGVVGLLAAAVPAAYGSPGTTGHLQGSAAQADGHAGPTAYVSTSARTVVPINVTTSTALKAIKLRVGGVPVSMAITRDGKTIYVVSLPDPGGRPPSPSGYVTPISTATDRTGHPIRLRGYPGQILITPNDRTAYVHDGDTVVPVNLRTGQPLAAIKVHDAGEMVMAPSGRTIYVTAKAGSNNNPRGAIVPIDLRTGKALKPILAPRTVNDVTDPVITPNGATLYVMSLGTTYNVLPVSTATRKVLKPIRVILAGPIAIGPDGAIAYVSTWHGVQPIDTATNKPLKFIRLGVDADSFAFAPNGRTLYVLGRSSVIPISTATGTAGKTIGVPEQTGWEAGMIAVAPDGNICVASIYFKPYVNDPFGTAGAMTVIPAGSRTPGKAIPIDGGPTQLVLAP